MHDGFAFGRDLYGIERQAVCQFGVCRIGERGDCDEFSSGAEGDRGCYAVARGQYVQSSACFGGGD